MMKAWRDQIETEIEPLEEAYSDNKITAEEYRRERLHVEHSSIQTRIEKIIAEAERYQHIFFTEKGSFYFVLKTGESMRLKASVDENGKSAFSGESVFNSLMRGIAFIDPSELAKQKNTLDNLEFYSSITLTTIPLAEGCIPFEYEPLEWVGRRATSETEGIVEWDEVRSELTLKGWANKQGEDLPQCFNGYPRHIGHPVKRIVV